MNISVGWLPIKKLFEGKHKLVIPDFQRPYDWNEEQVEQLIEDLIEAYGDYKNKDKKKQYLVGNLVFFKENKTKEDNKDIWVIVDGQQRIITFALIFKYLGKDPSILREREFIRNESWLLLSAKRIIDNYRKIRNRLKNLKNKDDFIKFLEERVIFTYTETDNIDIAFTLFDSQNTRGKPLKRKDLLKVHHIRFIKDDEYELRRKAAQKWEIMSVRENENNPKDKLDELLELLAIVRKGIRGELEGSDLVEVDVYREFKTECDMYKLNNYNQPPIFENFHYDLSKDEIFLELKPIKGSCTWIIDGWKYIPFQISQSIEGGEKFFFFVHKYYKLLEELEKIEEGKIFGALNRTQGSGNMFLKKVYKSLLLFFVDKFGIENSKEFAVRVLTLFCYFRMIKKSIRKEGVVKFEWSGRNNEKLDLYKLIFLKYCPKIINKSIDNYVLYCLSNEDELTNEGSVKNNFLNSIDKSLQKGIESYLRKMEKKEIIKKIIKS